MKGNFTGLLFLRRAVAGAMMVVVLFLSAFSHLPENYAVEMRWRKKFCLALKHDYYVITYFPLPAEGSPENIFATRHNRLPGLGDNTPPGMKG